MYFENNNPNSYDFGPIPPVPPVENFKIYLITKEKGIKYWKDLNQGVSDMSKLTGIGYVWDAPERLDTNAQIAIIKNAINQGADAIMLAVIDPVMESGIVEDAKAHSVKIIYVDSPANEAGIITLATDNYDAGMIAGQSMLSELNDLGIRSGSIGIVGENTAMSSTAEREKGFREVMDEDGRFQVPPTKYSFGNPVIAKWEAEEFLADNPDLVGLFGTNESATTGVGRAIGEAQKPIVGIGFDLTKTIQQYIDEGVINVVLVQNPYTMGYLGMAQTIAALKGYSTGPAFLNTGITVRTKHSH